MKANEGTGPREPGGKKKVKGQRFQFLIMPKLNSAIRVWLKWACNAVYVHDCLEDNTQTD